VKRWFGILALVVSMAIAGGWVYGQGVPESAPRDKPQPGVARISLIHGDVSIQRGDSGDWVAAILNTPAVSGDKVSTGQSSRTELQLDYANILRLSGQSEANVASLDRTHIQVQLARGLAFYTVFKGAEADAEIDAPNVAVHPRGEGEIRIQVNPSGETVVVVRKGEADLSTSQGSTRVHKGQMVTIRGTGADAQYLTAEAPSNDEWDRFNEDRDKRIRSAQSWARVDPYYTGADDLDAYGHWIDIPDYGWVWSPTVAPDWAPYRAGNWVWEPYYGWTWVSYEPWGWAPYHYGRWCLWNSSWVWWPGPRWYRPIWAPAYVSFFGFGVGHFGLSFGFGFGFGSIGWFPIGPCDPFFPWYGRFGMRFGFANFFGFHDHNFFRNHPGAYGPLAGRFNERFSNFRMAERDPRFLRGMTSVRAEEFGRGIGRRATGVSASDFRSGHVMTGGVPAVPTRQSLAPSTRAASPSTIRNEQGMRFFDRSQSSPAPRASFNEQAGRVQEALRGSSASSTVREGMQRGGATPGVAGRPGLASQPATSTRPPSGSISRPGSGSAATSNRPGQAAGASEGWQRFGGSRGAGTSGGSGSTVQPNRGAAGEARTGPSVSNPRSDRSPRTFGTQDTRPQQNSQAGGNQGSWQRFSSHPAESPAQSPAGRSNGPASQPRYEGNSPYGRGPAPSYSTRPNYSAPRDSTRPPLNLSRPIISGSPRSAPSRGFGGYSGGASQGSRSAPRGGGGGRSSGSSHRR